MIPFINSAALSKGHGSSLVVHYYHYMLEIATFLGANTERAATELKESLDFEIKLAQVRYLSRDGHCYIVILYTK